VVFETKIVVTDVSEREELLGQIEALNPDLVVVGRRGLGTLAKYVAPHHYFLVPYYYVHAHSVLTPLRHS
jgi:hypothetical protein